MLKPLREIKYLDLDYATPDTSERGGILCIVQVSGCYMARYVADPSGAVPLGIQYNDVEYMDLSRQVNPQRNREVDVPFSTVGAVRAGKVETDWIHAVGP